MRKKMVDGKGGNLKTIHHYKLKGFFVTTPPFRLYLRGSADGKEGKPSTDLTLYRRQQHHSERKKVMLLFRTFFPFPASAVFQVRPPERLSRPLPHSESEKSHTHESGRGQYRHFFPCCPANYPAFFSFHERINSQFLLPEDGSRVFSWCPLPVSPPGRSPFCPSFSKSDANKTALPACTISFEIL